MVESILPGAEKSLLSKILSQIPIAYPEIYVLQDILGVFVVGIEKLFVKAIHSFALRRIN